MLFFIIDSGMESGCHVVMGKLFLRSASTKVLFMRNESGIDCVLLCYCKVMLVLGSMNLLEMGIIVVLEMVSLLFVEYVKMVLFNMFVVVMVSITLKLFVGVPLMVLI